MNRKTILLGLSILFLGLIACDEKEIPLYSAEEGIYFNKRERVGDILTDSSNFTFVYIESTQTEGTVSIPVQLVGRATDSPRPVSIKVVGGTAREGEDYTLPENPVLPAGASSFDYVVTLKRTASLQTEAKTVELEIEENEYFKPIITEEVTSSNSQVTALRHKIEFSELFITAPAAWRTYIAPFTPQRFFLLCRVMDIPRADFNDATKISEAKFSYLVTEMKKYVTEEIASGDPDPEIFDENGQPIF